MSRSNSSHVSLTSQETAELVKVYQQSPSLEEREAAANRIIEGNEGLIKYIMNKNFSSYMFKVNEEDLLQEGRLGVFEAMQDYDPSRGAFSTHAVFKILHNMYVRTGMDSNTTTYYMSQARSFKKAMDELIAEGNTSPDLTEVAAKMNVGMEALQKLLQVMNRTFLLSLDNADGFRSSVSDPNAAPDLIAIENQRREAIEEALKRLSREQRVVIDCIYLKDTKPMKLAEIGKLLGGKKPDEVQRIKRSALTSMRKSLTIMGYGQEQTAHYENLANNISINIMPSTAAVRAEINIAVSI